jgi:hypothetical protein
LCFYKPGHLAEQQSYFTAADHRLHAAQQRSEQSPCENGAMLLAFQEVLDPAVQLINRGKTNRICTWQTLVRQRADIRTRLYAISNADKEILGSLQQQPASNASHQ